MTNITFTDNQGLPLKEAFETMHPLEILSDSRIDEIKQKLLAARGDFTQTDLKPRDVRNFVYTQRLKAKPLSPTSEGATDSATKSRASKVLTPTVNLTDFLE